MMLVIILALLLLTPAISSLTASRVVSVYDGDTFRVDIDDWLAIIGQFS